MDPKKLKELWVFELFKDKLSEEPIADVVHEDAPDFAFSLRGDRIGLEVTELFHDSFEGLSPSMQKSSFGSKFVAEVIQLLSQQVDFSFGIGVVFNQNVIISLSRRSELIAELAEKCSSHLNTLQNKQHVDLDKYYDGLPIEVHHVSIVRYDGMEESFDIRSEGGTIPMLERMHLDQVISRKESKIQDWVGYRELWLLIREGNYFAGSFTLPENMDKFVSKFNRVYLMRTRGVIELIRLC